MSDEDDWDFAGNADAKVTIHAAVRYLLKMPLAVTAATLLARSSRSCAKPRMAYQSVNPIRSMMRRLADSPSPTLGSRW
jgi:hypothetical protein